jgi:hypothetical protein
MSRHTGFRCLETGVSYVLSQNTLTRSTKESLVRALAPARDLASSGP